MMNLLSIKLSQRSIFVLSIVIIILYYFPYFFFGENSKVLIHDNLDSNLSWIKILMDNNALNSTGNATIKGVLNGLPISSIYPYHDISKLIFSIFGMYWGYIVNKLIISIIGFIGMYFLLKKHFLTNRNSNFIIFSVSIIFSLLPFWSFTATVLGLPLVVFALLNLRQKNYKLYNWIIIFLFAFYSSLILSGVFLLICIGLLFLRDTLKFKKINFPFLLGIIFLSISYILSHISIVLNFFGNFISHREEFYTDSVDLSTALKSSLTLFSEGQYHAHSLHNIIIIPILIVLIYYWKTIGNRFKIILLFLILTSLFYGLKDYHYFKPIQDYITNIIPLQLQRFHFLHPMLWYILLGLSLYTINSSLKHGKKIVLGIICIQFLIVLYKHELLVNKDSISFKDFYSTKTFNKVKNVINKPISTFKVAAIGFHPSILQYNGFQTLDGYFPSYPLEYKHQFRKIISKELERSTYHKSYFDNWGSRCYLFPAELRSYLSNEQYVIDTLLLDYNQFNNLGGEYILSAPKINTKINPQLELIDSVKVEDEYWIINIYKIK